MLSTRRVRKRLARHLCWDQERDAFSKPPGLRDARLYPDVFGSLTYADYVTENHFWREQLLMMSSPGDSQTEMIAQTLKKRLHVRADDYHLQNSADWEGLAGAVAGMESKLKRPKHTVRFDTLLTAGASNC